MTRSACMPVHVHTLLKQAKSSECTVHVWMYECPATMHTNKNELKQQLSAQTRSTTKHTHQVHLLEHIRVLTEQ